MKEDEEVKEVKEASFGVKLTKHQLPKLKENLDMIENCNGKCDTDNYNEILDYLKEVWEEAKTANIESFAKLIDDQFPKLEENADGKGVKESNLEQGQEAFEEIQVETKENFENTENVIDHVNTVEKKENETLIENIVDELLLNLVECSPKQVYKQNISNGSEDDDFIPVIKGVKKSNFKQCEESFKTSNKFAYLECEPTFEACEEIEFDTKENETLMENIVEDLLFNLVQCSTRKVCKENISNGSDNDWIPVTKGVKKTNSKQGQESLKTSNTFSALDLEPTFKALEEIEFENEENAIDENNMDEKKENRNLIENIINELLTNLVDCSNSNQCQESLKTFNMFFSLETKPTFEAFEEIEFENNANIIEEMVSSIEQNSTKKNISSSSPDDFPTKSFQCFDSFDSEPKKTKKRCKKCHDSHFPWPKFCRWSQNFIFDLKTH